MPIAVENPNLNRLVPGLVSVIVPCYNYGHFLPETLNSVLNQTYLNWECIIVNDGSSDDTQSISRNYITIDRRFTYVYQHNKGLSSARNAGINNSQGEFIQLLDADDLIEHQKIQHQVDYLQDNADVDIVYSNTKFFVNNLSNVIEENENMFCVSGQGESLISRVLEKNITVVSAPLFRKKIIEKIGVFDEKLDAVEDYDFWLRCALNGCRFQYHIFKDSATLIRKGHESMSINAQRMLINNYNLRKELEKRLGNKKLIKINKTHLNDDVILYGNQIYKLAVYSNFQKYIWQLLRSSMLTKNLHLFKLFFAAWTAKIGQLLAKLKRQVILNNHV